jgi:hypothetical protein
VVSGGDPVCALLVGDLVQKRVAGGPQWRLPRGESVGRPADSTLETDLFGPLDDLSRLLVASRPDPVVEVGGDEVPVVFLGQRAHEVEEGDGIGAARDGQKDTASRREQMRTAGEMRCDAIEERGRSTLLRFSGPG